MNAHCKMESVLLPAIAKLSQITEWWAAWKHHWETRFLNIDQYMNQVALELLINEG